MKIAPLTPDDTPDVQAIKSWRKAVRAELVARRTAVGGDEHARWSAAIDRHLSAFLRDVAGKVIAFCWPFQAEYDARSLMLHLFSLGAQGALPVVVAPRTPLVFRHWDSATEMAPDAYDIPAPVGTSEVRPDFVLLAFNGFDERGYRLGYGEGFFDRTLASMANSPIPLVTIGVGFEIARLPTIYPLPHDIALDYIVTEAGVHRREENGLRLMASSFDA